MYGDETATENCDEQRRLAGRSGQSEYRRLFCECQSSCALNVNRSANWPNNSVNMADILLNPSVPPNEVRALRFIHIADGGINTGDFLLPSQLTSAVRFLKALYAMQPDDFCARPERERQAEWSHFSVQ